MEAAAMNMPSRSYMLSTTYALPADHVGVGAHYTFGDILAAELLNYKTVATFFVKKLKLSVIPKLTYLIRR